MRRFDRLERILQLDPDRDCEEIYRLLAEYEFPWDITKALEFALFRTYAVPSIGRLLDRTGEFTHAAQKRYDDTVLILFEIFHWGTESDRGRQALEQLNAIHGRFRISNEDYVYTLSTFVVTPVRWIDQFGWRKLHPREVRALTNTMRRLGEGMKLSGIPETYVEFERFFDDYEREHFSFDAGGRRVADATLELFGAWYPSLLSPAVARAARFLMEPHLLTAFGFPQVAGVGRKAAEAALKVRAGLVRMGPARPDSRPVAPDPLSYPDGYEIADLGPDSFHHYQAKRRAKQACPVAT
ncbi:oxygenase MpaB family protein [Saccharopolyspora shandongensis]|uniref:oxygenase MpaB family protein n=1 Tax=Saccharopolyspora shandongensis TaxID=418495 RepID=UPI00343BB17A